MADLEKNKGVMVLLVPIERTLIRDALERLHDVYLFSPAEEEIYENLMRRIPDPKGTS